jgi:ribosomal protein S27E
MTMKRIECEECRSTKLTFPSRGVLTCKSCGIVQSEYILWTAEGASALLAAVMAEPDPASISAQYRGSNLVSFVTAMTEDPYEINMALIAAVILHVCREDQTQAQIRAVFNAIIKALESARDTEVPQA